MNQSASLVPTVVPDLPADLPIDQSGSGILEALHQAISEAIDALVAWDLPAFQSAVERQHALCGQLARHGECRQSPGTAAVARKVQDLNRIYDRLLRHSILWTRTLRSIFEAAGNPQRSCASVHFRG